MRRTAAVTLCLTILMLQASVAWALSPFIVFFDRDSARLTPQAIAILDDAARGWRQMPLREIVLFGHADRSGSAVYNLALSRRRVDAVRAGLIERGFPADQIRTEAHGEDRPLVDTADGAVEPQNRRVEIVIVPACGYWGPRPERDC